MFDIPTDLFHGHSNYLEIEIFDFGNFSKFREKTPGKLFPGKKFSRELPGNHFLGQNYNMNPIGHLFSICDVTCGSDFSYSLTDALLRPLLMHPFLLARLAVQSLNRHLGSLKKSG